ncbi:hypothetical protein KBB74_01400 [Candidatus Parcubacteria bacterium]|nr:hypothetical protein [Candidatus Parcubacteria bacterium]
MNFEQPLEEQESRQEKSPEELQKIGENVIELKQNTKNKMEELNEERRSIIEKLEQEEDPQLKQRLEQVEIILSQLEARLELLEGLANED